MAKIQRPVKNISAFASNQGSGERNVFGTDVITDELDQNISDEYKRGFKIYGPQDVPEVGDMNGWAFTMSRLNSYIAQKGIPEWNANQEYFLGSIASFGSDIFVSTRPDNIGNNPLDSIVGEFLNDLIPYSEVDSETRQGNEIIVTMDENNIVIVQSFQVGAGDLRLYSYKRNAGTQNWLLQSSGLQIFPRAFSQPISASRISESRFAIFSNVRILMFSYDSSDGSFSEIGNLDAPRGSFTGTNAWSSRFPTNSFSDNRLLGYKYSSNDTFSNSIFLYEFNGSSFDAIGSVYEVAGDDTVKFAPINNELNRIIMHNESQDKFSILEFNDMTGNFVVIDSITSIDLLGNNVEVKEIRSANGFDNYVSILTNSRALFVGYISDEFIVTNAEIIAEGSGVSPITSSSIINESDVVVFDTSASDELRFFENNATGGEGFWRYIPGETLGFNPSGTSLTSTNLDDAVKQLLPTLFPVGKILITDREANPSTYLGFGNWSRIEGRFLVSIDDLDSNYDTPGQTGGSKTHVHDMGTITVGDAPLLFKVPVSGWGSVQDGTSLPEPSTQGRLVTGSGRYEKAEALESLGHATNEQQVSVAPHTHTNDGNILQQTSLPTYMASYIWRRDS